MHKFDDQASKILLKVLSHTIERLSLDPPTLDYPKSVEFFEKNAPSLITEVGNSIDKVFDQYKNTIEQSIISADSPRNLSFIPAAPTKASMIFDLVVSAGSLEWYFLDRGERSSLGGKSSNSLDRRSCRFPRRCGRLFCGRWY